MEETSIDLNKEIGDILIFNEKNDELVKIEDVAKFMMSKCFGEVFKAITGQVFRVAPKDGISFTLGELQAIVGGTVMILQTKDTRLMIVNESGLALDLPPNLKATKLYKFDGCIFGNVLVCEPELLNIK